eukprot:8185375-Lingulodinium_polyedra.AAC.1
MAAEIPVIPELSVLGMVQLMAAWRQVPRVRKVQIVGDLAMALEIGESEKHSWLLLLRCVTEALTTVPLREAVRDCHWHPCELGA